MSCTTKLPNESSVIGMSKVKDYAIHRFILFAEEFKAINDFRDSFEGFYFFPCSTSTSTLVLSDIQALFNVISSSLEHAISSINEFPIAKSPTDKLGTAIKEIVVLEQVYFSYFCLTKDENSGIG